MEELSILREVRGVVKFSIIFKTAKSLNESLPITDAVYLFPSINVTSKILVALLTIWLLVMICFLVSYTKPEPKAVAFCSLSGLDGFENDEDTGTLLVIWNTEFSTWLNIEFRIWLCKLDIVVPESCCSYCDKAITVWDNVYVMEYIPITTSTTVVDNIIIKNSVILCKAKLFYSC